MIYFSNFGLVWRVQVLTDILVILRYLERLEVGQAQCITCLRTTQAFILSNALHLIQEKITTQQNPVSRIRSTATAFLSSGQCLVKQYFVEQINMIIYWLLIGRSIYSVKGSKRTGNGS